MKRSVTFRPAEADDSDLFFRIRRAAYKAYLEQTTGWDEADQRALHRQRFRPSQTRIVRWAGADVGAMTLVDEPDCLYLWQLFILPEHQGQGIGAACVRHVQAEARRRGVRVRMRVLKVNPRACALYQRLGFVVTGETRTHHLLEYREPAGPG